MKKLAHKAQFRRKGGRPDGSVVSLMEEKQRFTMVVWWLLHNNVGLGNQRCSACSGTN